jgi:TRAP-type transport system periplasmic protein
MPGVRPGATGSVREEATMKPWPVLTYALAAIVAGSAWAQDKVTMRLGHDLAPAHPWHEAALQFAADIESKSGGTLELKVFPSSQLGDLRELMELTQRGVLDMNLNTSGIGAVFVPDMNVFNLPFLFASSEQAAKFYASEEADKIKKSCEEAQIVCLSFFTTVFRSPMNNVRPIQTPKDMDGLKIRLMQVPIHIDTYSALGAAPTAIPFSELYTAAQTGVVDGFENSIGTLVTNKLHEVGKYLDTIPIFLYTNLLAMSQQTYDELSDSQRNAILESVPAFVESVNAAMLEYETAGIATMREQGVVVSTEGFDVAAFRAAVAPVYEKYVPTLSEDLQAVVEDLLRTQ